MATAAESRAFKAELAPLPSFADKGILRRCVQIMKRHRDNYFAHGREPEAPISVILTTLAARSYERSVAQASYRSEYEVLAATLAGMRDLVGVEAGRWVVANPVAAGENFAEKWNEDSTLAPAFFEWHQAACHALLSLERTVGVDQLGAELRKSFGEVAASAAISGLSTAVGTARRGGAMAIVGRTGAAATSRSIAVKPQTFFGC